MTEIRSIKLKSENGEAFDIPETLAIRRIELQSENGEVFDIPETVAIRRIKLQSENGEVFDIPETVAIRRIKLRSKNGEVFDVPETVAKKSQLINHTLRNDFPIEFSDEICITVENVTSHILQLVIAFCAQLDAADESKPETIRKLQKWESQFFNVDPQTIIDLIRAADYMHITRLLDSACQKLADLIKGKSPEVIRTTFNIINDYSPGDEERIRNEFHWAFPEGF